MSGFLKGCRETLEKACERAERALSGEEQIGELDEETVKDAETVFTSSTQAFREVLLGCVLARLVDSTIDISKPYKGLGQDAFSGRTLDEKVVNPFLKQKDIPSSQGPYLSVFRRSVAFDRRTREGIRDKDDYDAFLRILGTVKRMAKDKLEAFLVFILWRFLLLRESSQVRLIKMRLSLSQYEDLLCGLLSKPSGGRFPVVFTVAMLKAISRTFDLGWEIDYAGVNVADAPSGRGGDITVKQADRIVVTLEVTERDVDKARVSSTFQEKIAPAHLTEYLFVTHTQNLSEEAKHMVSHYFAQGYEVNFVDIREWLVNCLATVGAGGREIFQKAVIELLESGDAPAFLSQWWNEEINSVVGPQR